MDGETQQGSRSRRALHRPRPKEGPRACGPCSITEVLPTRPGARLDRRHGRQVALGALDLRTAQRGHQQRFHAAQERADYLAIHHQRPITRAIRVELIPGGFPLATSQLTTHTASPGGGTKFAPAMTSIRSHGRTAVPADEAGEGRLRGLARRPDGPRGRSRSGASRSRMRVSADALNAYRPWVPAPCAPRAAGRHPGPCRPIVRMEQA